jgi:two-component system, LuxR family, sensor kinase FixL
VFLRFVGGSRIQVLLRAGVLIAAIALLDWRFDVEISFGFLYLFPMLMVGGSLSRWEIAAVAALCTGLSEAFDPFPWAVPVGIPRLILTFAAFFGAGLFVYQSARNRRMANQHMQEIETEMELRREAEQQFKFLIESSPATILTLDKDGRILIANDAAHRLFGVEANRLQGQSVARYIPALASVPPLMGETSFFRTAMECRGRRSDGDMFQAQVWFSTYGTRSGPRLAAVVFDASDELRDREEFSLQQLLTGSKILVGAVCHEIRNICGAISVVQTKLEQNPDLSRNEDFRALGNLVDGLGRMAGLELQQSKPEIESIDLHSVLEELRIIVEPAFRESGASITWDIPDSIPTVWADPQALLQAFLNIAKNSQRAMLNQERRELVVKVRERNDSVVVRFVDTGHGVAHPEHLFQPFQRGAHATGLGLYLSRAFVRAFKGDIEYQPQPAGTCFAVVLSAAAYRREAWKGEDGESSTVVARRSHALSGEPQPAAGH